MRQVNKTARLKVAAVSFLNTVPFIYGIDNSDNTDCIDLVLGNPVQCAELLKKSEVDIALLPIGKLLDFKEINIIQPYCLASSGKVNSVFIFSDSKISNIKKIYLDSQSSTSNQLAKILCKHHWKIKAEFIPTDTLPEKLLQKEAMVAIGDKTFKLKNKFNFAYDLAEEWELMTNLPFVFAVWASVKEIDKVCLKNFNNSLELGLANIDKSLIYAKPNILSVNELRNYLNNNIKYKINDDMLKAIKLYLEYISPAYDNKINYI